MNGSKHKISLSETAYNYIKEAMFGGRIAPGDILNESQLAANLGMSRTPVREALRALASENWVEIKNGVGAYVKPISSKDIEDLYEIRCLLEPLAAKTSVYRISNEEIDDLEQRFRASLEGDIPPNIEKFSALDWEFHELIIERCQNNYIKTIMRNNTSAMKCYQFYSAEALNDIQESTLQHLNMLHLLRSRDVDAFIKALRLHLEWAVGFLKRAQH